MFRMGGILCTLMTISMLMGSAAHQIWPLSADQHFKLPDLSASEHLAPAPPCSEASFPHDLNGLKVNGLKAMPEISSVDKCMAACCAAGPSCQVYEWTGKPQSGASCWIGKYATPTSSGGQGYISRARGNIPPPPAPPPPPFPPGKPHTLDDSKGLGLRWEGIGAISGGGATSKLLMDYDPAVVSDILDFLFKPNWGLNLDILKVEMGGDTDSTEGAEPSHMHAGPQDENYNRGYEWWLMKEAKIRNPSIKLYGLPWGWPGWLDPTASATVEAQNAFADPNITANYTLAFLLGAKREHGLHMDYIGQWNERDAPKSYNDALRRVVGQAPELHNQTTVLNRLPHYPGTSDKPDPQGCTQYPWDTADGSRWTDEEGSIFDGRSARCLARCVNRGYVTGCHTATFQWHLISSFYDYLPWARDGVAVANEPWSGHYEVTSPTWSLAHTTQFSPPGWRMLSHDSGSSLLASGGSIVTRISPDKQDWSAVIEKMTTKNSICARGSNPEMVVDTEELTLTLKGSLLSAAKAKGITVWYSNLTCSNNLGDNPAEEQLFQKRSEPLHIGADGSVKLTVHPEEIYTLTTLKTGGKGVAPKPSPPSSPFPLPFRQDFDHENISAPPAYWCELQHLTMDPLSSLPVVLCGRRYDQMGAWEVQADPTKPGNHLMRQVSPVWPACWGYSCTGPRTYFGPKNFNASGARGFKIALAVKLEDDAVFGIGGSTGSKNFVGLLLDSKNATYTIGDETGPAASFKAGSFHQVEVTLTAQSVSATLDGKPLGKKSSKGIEDGFYIQMSLDRYVFADVDNFQLTV